MCAQADRACGAGYGAHIIALAEDAIISRSGLGDAQARCWSTGPHYVVRPSW